MTLQTVRRGTDSNLPNSFNGRSAGHLSARGAAETFRLQPVVKAQRRTEGGEAPRWSFTTGC